MATLCHGKGSWFWTELYSVVVWDMLFSQGLSSPHRNKLSYKKNWKRKRQAHKEGML